MPRLQKDKDFPILSSSDPPVKKKTESVASTSELMLAEQILAEVKSVASHVNNIDELIGARLDTTDVALNKIKVSVTSVEGSLLALSNQVTDLEKYMDDFEERFSATEDTHGTHGTLEKTVEQLQLKIDDLEKPSRENGGQHPIYVTTGFVV